MRRYAENGSAETIRRMLREVPVLNTDRLRLRPLCLEDAPDIFAYATDPEIARYVTWEAHHHLRDSEAFVAAAIGRCDNGEGIEWAIELKDDYRVIGTGSIFDWNAGHGRAEIGYTLARRYWGRGLMTEAVRAIIHHGFQAMRLHRIQARVMDGNTASMRVLEKAGLICEGTLRHHLFCKGDFRDVMVFSILRSEYLPAPETASSTRGARP